MAIWQDKIADIIAACNFGSIYNTARTTSLPNLGLTVYNQAQDYLIMYKPWRDLRVVAQLTLASDRSVTIPADFGECRFCYTDPAVIGKPMYFYYLNANDVTMRYSEKVTTDPVTGAKTMTFQFPPTVFIPQNPYIVYSKVLPNATQDDINSGKISFFPMNVMLVVMKKYLQDFYGVAANQDPNWINNRMAEELRLFESYAYQNNEPLDMSIHDRFGNPVFIQGMSLDGSKPRLTRPSPFLPTTFFTGGTG
jgi:hypothetical protein